MRSLLGVLGAVLVAACTTPIVYTAEFGFEPNVTSATIEGRSIPDSGFTSGFVYEATFDNIDAAAAASIPIIVTSGSGTLTVVTLTPSKCNNSCTESGAHACDSVTSEDERLLIDVNYVTPDAGGCVFEPGDAIGWGFN